jgi:hypothetical protein
MKGIEVRGLLIRKTYNENIKATSVHQTSQRVNVLNVFNCLKAHECVKMLIHLLAVTKLVADFRMTKMQIGPLDGMLINIKASDTLNIWIHTKDLGTIATTTSKIKYIAETEPAYGSVSSKMLLKTDFILDSNKILPGHVDSLNGFLAIHYDWFRFKEKITATSARTD